MEQPQPLPESNESNTSVDDRLRALDEANSRSIEFFDLLESFDKALSVHRDNLQSQQSILHILRHHVLWLVPFDIAGFWIPDPDTHEFCPCDVIPESEINHFQSTIEPLLESGTFGWALRQNRPVMLHSNEKHPACLLHALATPGRKIGMFAGLFLSGSFHEHDPHWRMLSVLLQRGAHAIESNELNRQIRLHNQHLEQLVAERTSALQSALLSAQEAETMFKGIFNESPDVILVLDPGTHKILAANPAVQSLLGHHKNDLLDQSFNCLLPPNSTDSAAILLNEIERHDIARVSLPLVKKTGNLCRMDLNATLLPWREGKGILVTLRDTTLREAVEEQRLKVSKLESLGDLAGSIAHNFNNLLMGISGNIELAQIETTSDKQQLYWKKAEEACDHAKEVAGRLLTFSRGGAPVCKPVCVKPMLEEAIKRCALSENYTITLSCPENILPAQADEMQITQAIQQLVLNAAESMPHGGPIALRATAENNRIQIVIEDKGCGVPEQDLVRILDPYVSTKPGRQGLGLTIANSIIENHHGSMTLSSKVGSGTSVQFLIPAGKPALVPAPITNSKPSMKILYMDDEPSLRLLMENILAREKHKVVCAENGDEAIALFQAAKDEGEPFDLAILDLTIADGKGGVETIQALKQIDPNVRAIACSGYSSESVMAEHGHHGFMMAIPKPFKIDQLIKILRSLPQ